MTKVWVSSPKFTGQVDVSDNNKSILTAPPVWRKFQGQRLENLVLWLMKFGKVEVEVL